MSTMAIDPAFEPQYTVEELANLWKFDRSTISRWFHDEPGVLKYGQRSTLGRKRTYVTLRIPASVARRIYERHSR